MHRRRAADKAMVFENTEVLVNMRQAANVQLEGTQWLCFNSMQYDDPGLQHVRCHGRLSTTCHTRIMQP